MRMGRIASALLPLALALGLVAGGCPAAWASETPDAATAASDDRNLCCVVTCVHFLSLSFDARRTVTGGDAAVAADLSRSSERTGQDWRGSARNIDHCERARSTHYLTVLRIGDDRVDMNDPSPCATNSCRG